MSDPYIEQARAMASLSAENGLLREKIERLRALLKSASHHVDNEGDVSLLTDIRRALEARKA